MLPMLQEPLSCEYQLFSPQIISKLQEGIVACARQCGELSISLPLAEASEEKNILTF